MRKEGGKEGRRNRKRNKSKDEREEEGKENYGRKKKYKKGEDIEQNKK